MSTNIVYVNRDVVTVDDDVVNIVGISAQGPAGATGATGPAGQGVAAGGTAGQFLIKSSGTDYDTAWDTLDASQIPTLPISQITNLQTTLDGKQPLDSDLTAIAALTPTDNDILQRISGAWTNRTMAQLYTSLGLGTIATQNASAVAITGGTINGATIGATTPASGAFTTLTATGNIRAGYNAGFSIRNSTNTADILALTSPGASADTLRLGNTTTVLEAIGTTIEYRSATNVRLMAMSGVGAANVHFNPDANAAPASNSYLQVTGAAAGNTLIYLYANGRESVNFGRQSTESGHFVYIRSINTGQRTLRLDALTSQSVEILQIRDASANDLMTLATNGATAHFRRDTGTADTQTVLTIGRNSTNTPAANFASRLLWQLESSTTENQDAAGIVTSWVVATHASRTARQVFNIYDTAAREALRLEASGSAPMIGFLGAAAVARQALGAWAGLTTDQKLDALRDALTNLGLTSYT